eukprot:TRINITY_DN37369_c0_g1_i1.p1 TRINITY_DN37369_c0_g1~~TRINITY_DN37369_c0_g1_i1.p1  ORF type:complete len:160 (+),score=34.73 TRINITY_DN37369_c0_g1_i1:115-594(+)
MTSPEDAQALRDKIHQIFTVFDHDSTNAIEVKELSTVIRSLGISPPQAELQNIIKQIEIEGEARVHYERVEQVVLPLLTKDLYPASSIERLQKAFKVLDPEGKGYIDAGVLSDLLTSQGEALTGEEVEEMLAASVDAEHSVVYYEDYLSQAAALVEDDN